MNTTWSGTVVGKMHVYELTVSDIAERARYNSKYISTVINSEFVPKSFRKRIDAALDELIAEKSKG